VNLSQDAKVVVAAPAKKRREANVLEVEVRLAATRGGETFFAKNKKKKKKKKQPASLAGLKKPVPTFGVFEDGLKGKKKETQRIPAPMAREVLRRNKATNRGSSAWKEGGKERSSSLGRGNSGRRQ